MSGGIFWQFHVFPVAPSTFEGGHAGLLALRASVAGSRDSSVLEATSQNRG